MVFIFVTLGLGFLIAIPFLFALMVVAVVGVILGCLRANEGRPAKYPLAIPFFR